MGGFYTKEISQERLQEILARNEVLSEINKRLEKCRHLVGSFNHNGLLNELIIKFLVKSIT